MVGIDSCWLCVEMCVVGTWRFLNCLRAELTSTSLTARQRRHRRCAKFKVVPRTPSIGSLTFLETCWLAKSDERTQESLGHVVSVSERTSIRNDTREETSTSNSDSITFHQGWPPDSFGSELQLSVATNAGAISTTFPICSQECSNQPMNMEQSSAHSGRKHFGRGNESWELVSNSFSEWLVHRPPLLPTDGGSWDFPLSHVERRQLVVLSLTAEVDQRQAQLHCLKEALATVSSLSRSVSRAGESLDVWTHVKRSLVVRREKQPRCHDPPGLAWEMPMSVQERQDFSISSLILESDERWAETEALVQELTGALTTQSAASNSPNLIRRLSSIDTLPAETGGLALSTLFPTGPYSFAEWLARRSPLCRGCAWEFPLSKADARELLVLSLVAEDDQRVSQVKLLEGMVYPVPVCKDVCNVGKDGSFSVFGLGVELTPCGCAEDFLASLGQRVSIHQSDGLGNSPWEYPMSEAEKQDFLVLSLTAEGQQRWDTAQKLMESVMHAATLVTIPREASLPSSLQESPKSIGFCAAGKIEIPSPFPAAASFKEWLEDHVPMLRGGVCSHVAWEFPLSKQETRLLLLLSLMSEGQLGRAQVDFLEQSSSLPLVGDVHDVSCTSIESVMMPRSAKDERRFVEWLAMRPPLRRAQVDFLNHTQCWDFPLSVQERHDWVVLSLSADNDSLWMRAQTLGGRWP